MFFHISLYSAQLCRFFRLSAGAKDIRYPSASAEKGKPYGLPFQFAFALRFYL
jgi:hypothetical protein